jgi:malonyl CoA-acyl carrier protein transacylase/NAD(P)-dependent dehydrogenase (short-subunit alcohol dehydrogenase family)
MAAVSAPAAQVRAVLGSTVLDGTGVVLANHNAPGQAVISGPTPAVEAAIEAFAERGVTARRIPVACAFHSPLVAPAAGKLAAELAGRNIRPPRFPVFANSTAAPYPGTPDAIRAIIAGQVAEPVRFAEQVEAMYEAGARTFVEAGPGRILTGLVGQILGDRPHTAVACDVPGENGLHQLLIALAELIRARVPVDPAVLFAGRASPVAAARKRPQWTVDGHLVRTTGGQPIPGGLQPAGAVSGVSLGAATSSASDRDRVVTEFLRTTRELVATQRDVMMGYLGTAPAPAATPISLPEVIAAPEVTAGPAGVTAARAGEQAVPASRAEIGEAVVDVVSARTGYPRDMLGADLDLEADLSVDSIKRTEIIGALAERLGLDDTGSGIDESIVGQLTRIKTISGIADWLAEQAGVPTSDATDEDTSQPEPLAGTPDRYLVETAEVPAITGGAGPQGRVLIVDDGRGIALELADLLEQSGAEAVTVETPTAEQLADADALVHLGALRPGARPLLPDGFPHFRDALTSPIRTLLVATATGGTFGHGHRGAPGDGVPSGGADLGLRGMIRTIAAEYPQVVARAVDVEPKESPRATAAQLLAELTDRDGPSVVGYRGGRRVCLRVRRAEPPERRADGLGIDRDGVVLLTGGARGITAAVALALARATGCHIELIGRTPAPGTPDPEIASASDAGALRRLLIGRGMDSPKEIEAAAGRILREREVRSALEELRAAASSVRYHAVDVRDKAAVGAVLDDLYARHGRLDGVIHGAGLVEDRLVPDKSPESFARVYATKVDGARALRDRLRGDLRFLVLFGSVSGVFGNRGQIDYSAGNDALDTLANLWSTRLPGRVVCLDWGPWAGRGMVSAELGHQYARRGVTLIDPDAGVACLLAELAADSGPAQVIYMCDAAADE